MGRPRNSRARFPLAADKEPGPELRGLRYRFSTGCADFRMNPLSHSGSASISARIGAIALQQHLSPWCHNLVCAVRQMYSAYSRRPRE